MEVHQGQLLLLGQLEPHVVAVEGIRAAIPIVEDTALIKTIIVGSAGHRGHGSGTLITAGLNMSCGPMKGDALPG